MSFNLTHDNNEGDIVVEHPARARARREAEQNLSTGAAPVRACDESDYTTTSFNLTGEDDDADIVVEHPGKARAATAAAAAAAQRQSDTKLPPVEHLDSILKYMTESGFDVRHVGIQTLLHEYAEGKRGDEGDGEGEGSGESAWNLAACDFLIRAGFDVDNARRGDYRTPLHQACEYSKLELVQLFLHHGADVNAVAKGGVTPLKLAMAAAAADPRDFKDSKKILLLLQTKVKTAQNPMTAHRIYVFFESVFSRHTPLSYMACAMLAKMTPASETPTAHCMPPRNDEASSTTLSMTALLMRRSKAHPMPNGRHALPFLGSKHRRPVNHVCITSDDKRPATVTHDVRSELLVLSLPKKTNLYV